MESQIKISAAQINTKVGDVAGNIQKILSAWDEGEANGADLIVTPELSVSGYPLEDQIENPDTLNVVEQGIKYLVKQSLSRSSAIIVGAPRRGSRQIDGRHIYNEALLIEKGEIHHIVQKHHLPNNDVFDEKRNSAPGGFHEPVEFRGIKLGILICEDTWYADVSRHLAEKGAQILVSINSSPFIKGKHERRIRDVAGARALENNLPVLYVNQVGGQDEVVFDGASHAVDKGGKVIYQAPTFRENNEIISVSALKNFPADVRSDIMHPVPDELERVWMALVIGTRDYIRKNGFKEIVLGESGGIDSALVTAIAADAIGGENVYAISMPYKYTSSETKDDARIVAERNGAIFEEIPIIDAVAGLQKALGSHFNANSNGIENENMQARERGVILMHLSNKYGWLLLSTGNKSEVGVGYCTLYGDTNGGFNPLKDVYKTDAFELCRWRNQHKPEGVLGKEGEVIPDSIIKRPPSAELAPDQKDENSLPPYPVLDQILRGYVEEKKSLEQICSEIEKTFHYVVDPVDKVDLAEYKRRQGCPGIKITECNFGKGRRFPITRPKTSKMIADMDRLENEVKFQIN